MKSLLSHRLSMDETKDICLLVQGEQNHSLKEQLYQLTLDDDRRVAVNALWTFTHFALADNVWLFAKHDQLIERAITEQDVTKLRLILTLLLRQPFDEEAVRTDFIDFCLTRLADPKSPYAVRALCIKLAFELMRHWPRTAKRTSPDSRNDKLRTAIAWVAFGLAAGDEEMQISYKE